MQFGIGVSTHINNWDIIRYAEALGYDRAWVGDSQRIWSDCYATSGRREGRTPSARKFPYILHYFCVRFACGRQANRRTRYR